MNEGALTKKELLFAVIVIGIALAAMTAVALWTR